MESQRFVPGQRLVETDLAGTFGVGRNAVREALQRLAADGIVDLHRHRGASIRLLSLQEAFDVMSVAELMTGLLASSAAANTKQGELTERLRLALEQLNETGTTTDPATFDAARRHFYRTLLEMGGNRELRRLFPAIQMHIVHSQFRLSGLREMRLADYERIGRAVLSGDSAAAYVAGIAHVQHVREAIANAYQPGMLHPR